MLDEDPLLEGEFVNRFPRGRWKQGESLRRVEISWRDKGQRFPAGLFRRSVGGVIEEM